MISKINEYMSLYPRDYLSSIGKKSVQLHFTISCPSKIRAVILIWKKTQQTKYDSFHFIVSEKNSV